jgi:predicted Zn-dependent protease
LNTNTQGFDASLFRPEFGNEVVHGKIFIDRDTVRFVAEGFSEEIPANLVKVTLEKDGSRVYFTDPRRPESQIFTPDLSILENPATWKCETIRSQVTSTLGHRELMRRLRITAYFLVACVLVVMIASWIFGAITRSVARRVPASWEQKFGEETLARVRKRFEFEDDSNRVAQIAAAAAPLIEALPPDQRNLKFYIVETDIPNAFALPGGHVVITTGLLNMVDRPEQLLGVLAHEMAHVTQKHFAQKAISAAGPIAVFGVFLHSDSGLMNALTIGSGLLVVQGFSKEYETEADEVGWDYLVKARIDPRGLIEMFQKFQSWQSARVMIRLPEAFESHPALEKRIANLERRARKLRTTEFRKLEPFDLNASKPYRAP